MTASWMSTWLSVQRVDGDVVDVSEGDGVGVPVKLSSTLSMNAIPIRDEVPFRCY